jgi:hypothetical protein
VRTAEPDPPATRVTDGLLNEYVRPAEDAARDIVPANPLLLVSCMFEVPGIPADRVRERGAAETPKSTTLIVTVTEWEMVPLVPVTVTA